MNIASSQTVWLNKGRLSDYGKSQKDYTTQMTSAIDQVLMKYGSRVIKEATENLDRSKAVATGNLRQSIIPIGIEVSGQVHRFVIELPAYYKFVDKGRGPRTTSTPSNPPLKQSIKEWITAKGITWQPKGKETIQDALDRQATIISRNINRRGTKGNNFMSNVFTDDFTKQLLTELSTVIGKQLVIQILEK